MIMDAVSWFDLAVVALVLVLGIKGLLNGFIKEIFGIIGLIGGVIVASRYANEVGELISKNIYAIAENFWFHIGFLITLIVFWVVCLGLGQIFNKILKMSGFSFLDRLLGFIVGSAKIFLVFAIFVFIISRIAIINEKIEPYSKKSFLYPFMLTAGEFIMNQNIPAVSEVKKISETATQNLKQEVQNAITDELNASINELNATLNIEPLNLGITENNASGL